MKLLFDENLSPKLPRILSTDFPESMHVRDCGLKGFPDEDVWEYARNNGFTVVSKDSDFYQRSLLYGHQSLSG
jgi:predicted nuclease of predicted toxin-antitoxin system